MDRSSWSLPNHESWQESSHLPPVPCIPIEIVPQEGCTLHSCWTSCSRYRGTRGPLRWLCSWFQTSSIWCNLCTCKSEKFSGDYRMAVNCDLAVCCLISWSVNLITFISSLESLFQKWLAEKWKFDEQGPICRAFVVTSEPDGLVPFLFASIFNKISKFYWLSKIL